MQPSPGVRYLFVSKYLMQRATFHSFSIVCEPSPHRVVCILFYLRRPHTPVTQFARLSCSEIKCLTGESSHPNAQVYPQDVLNIINFRLFRSHVLIASV